MLAVHAATKLTMSLASLYTCNLHCHESACKRSADQSRTALPTGIGGIHGQVSSYIVTIKACCKMSVHRPHMRAGSSRYPRLSRRNIKLDNMKISFALVMLASAATPAFSLGSYGHGLNDGDYTYTSNSLTRHRLQCGQCRGDHHQGRNDDDEIFHYN